jgi:hypothetical protein
MQKDELEQDLIEQLDSLSKDPYEFVLFSFPWGEGELKGFPGPDDWQADLLKQLRDGLMTANEVIQAAIASGHGVGKSAMVSWIILWAISTQADTKGVVTANTETQLRTKTWPEVSRWFQRFIGKHMFKLTATAIYSAEPAHEKTWRIDAIPWSDSNTEAFAGLHNQGKRILLVFDEASAIADKIWEVSEGALTDKDTEILWLAFGNPTRNTGRFRECFGRLKHRWLTRQVDSRTARMTNKDQLQKWITDYGDDSDFVRVRVKGEFPNTSDRQFIPSSIVNDARKKVLHESAYAFAPVVIGVDPAIYGDDECVIYMRQGLVSKQLATYRKIQDDFTLAGYVAQYEDEYKADAVFVDMGYGTGVVSAGRQMGRHWQIVPFAAESNDPGYLNKRAQMWGQMKKWMAEGGMIPDDPILAEELTGPEYIVKLNGKIQLEAKEDMRKRGMSSPNRADALCLTFAFPVQKKGSNKPLQFSRKDYDPLA